LFGSGVFSLSIDCHSALDACLQQAGGILQKSSKIPAFAPRGAVGASNDRYSAEKIPHYHLF
jgi:hypothetical protein